MQQSLITKKRIAKAFKETLTKKDFEKISVKDIMGQAQMRRQTFYSHFMDKYELMEWIFKTELQEQIIDNLNYISGIGLLYEICYFFEQNQVFYKALFSVHAQNDFLSYFQDYCLQLIVKIVAEYSEQHHCSIPQPEKNFFFHYHAAALSQMMKSCLDDKQTDYFLVAQHTETLLLSFLEHYTEEDKTS